MATDMTSFLLSFTGQVPVSTDSRDVRNKLLIVLCLLSSSSISMWGMIKTNTYLYRAIQYLHNGV